MLRKVKGVAARLWPSIVQFTLPLNCSKGAKVTRCARNQVVLKDGIELTYLPPIRTAPRRNTKDIAIIIANPFRQFGGEPSKDGMRCSVLVRDPLALAQYSVVQFIGALNIIYDIACYIYKYIYDISL